MRVDTDNTRKFATLCAFPNPVCGLYSRRGYGPRARVRAPTSLFKRRGFVGAFVGAFFPLRSRACTHPLRPYVPKQHPYMCASVRPHMHEICVFIRRDVVVCNYLIDIYRLKSVFCPYICPYMPPTSRRGLVNPLKLLTLGGF